jgi:hypothetical protein
MNPTAKIPLSMMPPQSTLHHTALVISIIAGLLTIHYLWHQTQLTKLQLETEKQKPK